MQKDNSENGTTHREKSQWDWADLTVILPAHIAPLSLLCMEARWNGKVATLRALSSLAAP